MGVLGGRGPLWVIGRGSRADVGTPFAGDGRLATGILRPLSQRFTIHAGGPSVPTMKTTQPKRIGLRGSGRRGGGVSRVSRKAASTRSVATPRGISCAATGPGAPPKAMAAHMRAARARARPYSLLGKPMQLTTQVRPLGATQAGENRARNRRERTDAISSRDPPGQGTGF